MAKKRTKKQKLKAQTKPVNSHFGYKFNSKISEFKQIDNATELAQKDTLGSIKSDISKSLFIALLITFSLMVIYWFS